MLRKTTYYFLSQNNININYLLHLVETAGLTVKSVGKFSFNTLNQNVKVSVNLIHKRYNAYRITVSVTKNRELNTGTRNALELVNKHFIEELEANHSIKLMSETQYNHLIKSMETKAKLEIVK